MRKSMRQYLISIFLLCFMSLPAYAVLDGAVCSSSDTGGTACNATQLKANINEEDQGLDDRAPVEVFTITGTNTYAGNVSPAITAYDPEMSAWIKVSVTNTGPATINFNTIAAKPLVSSSGAALGAGDVRSDTLYLIKRYAANDEFRIVTSLGSGTASASGDFVTIGNSASLTAERAWTAGTCITGTDGGANSTLTVGVTAACIGATQIGTDGVSADELNATGVEAELEAVIDLQDLQGAVTAAQLTAIDTSAEIRSLLTDELGTGVLFFLGAPAADDQVFVSTSISAGAWGSIPDSDAATQKLQYDVTTNIFSAGTDDDVPDAADYGTLALTGDVTSSGLTTTVAANAVALTTDTTGSYAAGDAEAGNALTGDSATAFFSAGALEVARGGTGAAPAADDQVLISSSISAAAWLTLPDSDAAGTIIGYDVTTNAWSTKTDDDVGEAGDFGALALTGDVTSSGLATTVAANAVALTTDTTGNYMADVAAGVGIATTHTPAEGSTGTIALKYSDTLAANPALNANECVLTTTGSGGGLLCEGSVADAFEGNFKVPDVTGADSTQTVITDATAAAGDLMGTYPSPTVAANAVALTTDTTGNYAAGDAEAGAALTGDTATAFFSAGALEDARVDGSLEADEVNPTLGTQTQGNYQTGNTAGTGIAVMQTPAEGFSATIAFDYSDAGANPALNADECRFTSNVTVGGHIVCEGDTADAFESRVVITDATADRAFTIPNADSSAVQPLTCGGTDKVSAISALGVVTCTTDAGGAGSGDNISVNGVAAADADFDDATPAAVSGTNVLWQKDAGAPNNVSAYVPASSATIIGAVELATTAEAASQTDTVRAVTPAGLAFKPESFCVAASDESTAITTGVAKVTFRMPYTFTLTNIRGSLNTVSSSGSPIIDVNEAGTSVMTTNKVLIDVSEKTSVTAVTAVTLTDTALADDAEITIDVDTAGTGAKGLKICLIGHQ